MGLFKPAFPQLQRGSRFASEGYLACAYLLNEGSGPKAYDSSGRANGTYDLTLQSTASWNGGGENGNALKLNGTSDYAIDPANHDSLNVDFTIASLFKLNSGFGTSICMFNGHNNDRYLGVASSKLQIFNGPSFPSGATTLSANKWYLGIGSVRGTTLRLWLNGKSDLNTTGSASSANGTNARFCVGAYFAGGGPAARFFPGLISFVMAWNRGFNDDDAAAFSQQYGPS